MTEQQIRETIENMRSDLKYIEQMMSEGNLKRAGRRAQDVRVMAEEIEGTLNDLTIEQESIEK